MARSIIHVDMDAFYASVEVRERPELAGLPVVVGGTPEGRGVVAAASYEARRFGIHSAMPTATALRLCPRLVVLAPRHSLYAEVSAQIHAIFQRYTPQVEPLALDEAFLDVSASARLFGGAAAIGRRIKAEVRAELGLVASVGVAPNKFLAKLAGDLEKPDGFVVVEQGAVLDFLAPLPVTRLWGVGKVAAERFARLGIETIGQLRGYSPRLLQHHFGSSGEHFHALARGEDERPVVADHEAKSISQEHTFHRDIRDPRLLDDYLVAHAEQVGRRLRRHGLYARKVFIKVRLADFTTLSRSITLSAPSDITADIREAARRLFRQRLPSPLPPVRLLGVGVGELSADPGAGAQAGLFDDGREQRRRLDTLVDSIAGRFGSDALRRGRGTGENGR